jgi:phosphoribosylanthranilate isomerase
MLPFFDHTPAAPKICGITSHEDALRTIDSGAGALGFNFYPPSPRAISSEGDMRWISKLKTDYPDIAMVAVVVNPDEELLKRLEQAECFDAIQFHGDESPEFCAAAGHRFPRWIKALRIRSQSDLVAATAFKTSFLLLDAAVPGTYGGSGHMIDWDLGSEFVSAHPETHVILAGGLNPSNVAEAVRSVRPHAVDVASGVESAPGQKDPEKVSSFIANAMNG